MIKSINDLLVYKVGGCVRDQLMGLPANDIDYVVVGATVDDMLMLGFKAVGNEFPVFIHPHTHEEYALARSEKKSGIGYKGFTFYTNTDVSLIDDLKRRDLTINAIAIDKHNQYIDPFGGIDDIKNKILKHVSNAFSEDPLRVLRIARFKAKLGFRIAPETIKLMKLIVDNKELLSLSNERIWKETHKALMTPNILEYFQVLYNVGALNQILHECTFLITNSISKHKLNQLNQKMNDKNLTLEMRFAILCYILNENEIDMHKFIQNSCMNKQARELAILIVQNYSQIHKLNLLSRDDIYNLIKQLDSIRKKDRYLKFIQLINLIAYSLKDNIIIHNLIILKRIIFKISKIDAETIKKNNINFVLQIKLEQYKIIDDVMSIFHNK